MSKGSETSVVPKTSSLLLPRRQCRCTFIEVNCSVRKSREEQGRSEITGSQGHGGRGRPQGVRMRRSPHISLVRDESFILTLGGKNLTSFLIRMKGRSFSTTEGLISGHRRHKHSPFQLDQTPVSSLVFLFDEDVSHDPKSPLTSLFLTRKEVHFGRKFRVLTGTILVPKTFLPLRNLRSLGIPDTPSPTLESRPLPGKRTTPTRNLFGVYLPERHQEEVETTLCVLCRTTPRYCPNSV